MVQRFSIGFKSGLYESHATMFSSLKFGQLEVYLAVCAGPSSWWKYSFSIVSKAGLLIMVQGIHQVDLSTTSHYFLQLQVHYRAQVVHPLWPPKHCSSTTLLTMPPMILSHGWRWFRSQPHAHSSRPSRVARHSSVKIALEKFVSIKIPNSSFQSLSFVFLTQSGMSLGGYDSTNGF